MLERSLNEILEFAMDKEDEAMRFYLELSGKVKKPEIATELKKLAEMERGHKERIKGFKEGKIELPRKGAGAATDMKIADYVVEKEVTPEMTWQNLLNVAMKRELASMRLYQDLGKLFIDERAKALFNALAEEEAAHKNYFETIWDEDILIEN
ncbi:MAG: hypothetical protein Kow0090_04750 [Myxococcota bacterium]